MINWLLYKGSLCYAWLLMGSMFVVFPIAILLVKSGIVDVSVVREISLGYVSLILTSMVIWCFLFFTDFVFEEVWR